MILLLLFFSVCGFCGIVHLYHIFDKKKHLKIGLLFSSSYSSLSLVRFVFGLIWFKCEFFFLFRNEKYISEEKVMNEWNWYEWKKKNIKNELKKTFYLSLEWLNWIRKFFFRLKMLNIFKDDYYSLV